MKKPNMFLVAIAVAIVFIIIVTTCTKPEQPEEQLKVCQNIVLDSYHYPEEYLPGSSNYNRLLEFGVQRENIGTLSSAQEDCRDG